MTTAYSINEFSLANKLYRNSDVTFYTISGGVKTTTKAVLYADSTATTVLRNPQTLDTEGKFVQSVFVTVPVIATISGLTFPDHDTGINTNSIFVVATDKGLTDADVVLTHADVVLTHADVVLTQADVVTATTQAGLATTQVGLATTNGAAQVVLATAQAVIATNEAGTATTQAGIATTQAGLATTNGAAQVVLATTQAGNALTSANNAATSETNALNYANRLTGTSTTTLTPAIASKVFTTQAGKDFDVGTTIFAVSAADPTIWMFGDVTGYATTTLTVNVTVIGTASSKADWNIYGRAGIRGATGATGAAGSIPIASGAGTVDAITANFTPDIALADMQLCTVVSSGANTSTTPTFAPDGLTAHTITTRGGAALVAGDIGPAGFVGIYEYNLSNTRWELLNPAKTLVARVTVASHATTADIWGAAGNQIDWTGTATTTAFPNAPQAGVERVLICAGACSFTAGANMLIDGVASTATVTCAVNDQVIVRAVSTTQFKLSRIKYDGTPQVSSSVFPDGITWTSRTSAADNSWRSVTYGNGLFVAVSADGTGNRVMTSPDGITWTIRSSAVDNMWLSVTYGNGLFVAVSSDGTGNHVMTSGVPLLDTLRCPSVTVPTRTLNTTYANTSGRSILVTTTFRCAVTTLNGNAYAIAKAAQASPPTTAISGNVGIQTGLLNEDATFQLCFVVVPGLNYRVDSVATNGTVTLGSWFEYAY
jgi:hypothetical protein